MSRQNFRRLVLTLALPVLAACNHTIAEDLGKGDLQPTIEQANATEEIIYFLESRHYESKPLNDKRSSDLLDNFLKRLDPERMFFLRSDIDKFNGLRKKLDDQLRAGDLSTGFNIYHQYLKRNKAHAEYALDLLNKGVRNLNFDEKEYIEVDREDADWFRSESAQRDYWRRRLKNEILEQRIAEKPEDEIIPTLVKRYEIRLQRQDQIKSEDIFQAYMNALGELYDPHTNYLSPRAAEDFDINMSLSLEGIGAVLQTDEEHTKIVRLVPGGPAAKSGELKKNDKIISVGQEGKPMVDVVGWRIDDVVQLIRGPKGSKVRIEIESATPGIPMKTVTIVRNRVELQDQAANKLVIPIERDGRTEKYGVIKLPAFYSDFEGLRDNKKDARSTSRDVARLTRALVKEGIDGLIIDLRDNGGGSLEEVNVMVNQFVGRGPTVQIRDARQRSEPMASRVHSPIYKGPMAVITNRTSASASEIFAGAMQDYGRALILGTPTYGKGTVQTVERLSHGELKYTIAKFYRVSGQSTQEKGVHPDIFFPAIYDSEVIGEDVLPTALKWDAIPRAPYRMRGQLTPYVAKLDSKHQERTRNVPEFVYNRAQMALTASLRETKALPLQASERMNYQKRINEERLAIENRKRIALGEKPFNSIKALNDHMEEEAQDAFERRKQADAYLEEATWILSDLMQSAREKRVGQET